MSALPVFVWHMLRGFGRTPRDLHENPLRERLGKHSPRGDSYYRSSSFWRTKIEKTTTGPVSYSVRSYSVPSRPDMHADCCTYTPSTRLSRRDITYPNLTIKCPVSSLSPAIHPSCPGPGAYDISPIIGGQTSRKPSLKQPYSHVQQMNASAQLPGPGSYTTAEPFGTGGVAISVSNRFPDVDVHRGDPDPHTYRVKRWND